MIGYSASAYLVRGILVDCGFHSARRDMEAILERERPWIELFHRENYALYHAWMRNVKPAGLSLPTAKYADLDTAQRKRLREAWNRPVVWPAWVSPAKRYRGWPA